ncbi:MAG: hypothetical protein ACI9AT_000048 [Ulvibacter sp.]|jgi:hypothetical protein
MKNLLKLTALILAFPIGIFAQTDSTIIDINETEAVMENETPDTTTISLGKTVILIIDDQEADPKSEVESKRERTQRLTHWTGFDIGVNGLGIGEDFVIDSEVYDYLEVDMRRSRSVSINFSEEKLRLISDYFGIFTGLGIEFNSYKFNNDYTLTSTNERTFGVIDSTISLKKNKLRTAWLTAPLMFEINTNLDTEKNAHLAFGVVGGWRLGTKYKQKYKKDGNNDKVKSSNNFNMLDYKLDASVRLGYRNFTLFANAGLTSLFEEGKIKPSNDSGTSADVFPFSVGIQLIGF